MLTQVAEGVLIDESEFCPSNAVVVQGRADVLQFQRIARTSERGGALG